MKKIFLFIFTIGSLSIQAQFTFEKQYGDSVDCSGINVIQTFDGGFLITASKNPGGLEYDLFIIKTDPWGDTLWTKDYNVDSGYIAKGIQTFDSGFVFTGKKGIYLLIFKVNSEGDSIWEKEYYFGSSYARGFSIIEARDHTLFIAGEVFIGGAVCCYPLVIRTDMTGNQIGTIGIPISYGRAYDIVETPDSNFVISYSQIYGSPPLPALSKVTKTGSVIWDKWYSHYCQCNVNLTHDNGFIISGLQINTLMPYLLKTDTGGNVIWDKSYSTYNLFNYDLKVTQSNDEGYLMVGGYNTALSDLTLLKVNSLGDSVWGRAFGGVNDDFGKSIITTNDNGFAIVGYTKSFGSGSKEIYFIKSDSLGLITTSKAYPISEKQIKIFPNPFSTSTTLQTNTKFSNSILTIYNSFGQQVKQIENLSGQKVVINRDNLPGGLYFLKLTEENNVIAVEKMVITD